MKKPNYLLPIIIIVVGIMALIASIYFDIKNASVDDHYLTMNDSKTVYLTEGKYTVFIDVSQFDYVNLQDNVVTISSNFVKKSFGLVIKDKETNEIITLEKLRPNTTLEYNNHQGILQIKIKQSGYYLIETQKENDQYFENKLLISNIFDNVSYVFIAIAKSIAICGITGISALISFIVIYRKRKKCGNEQYIS